MRFSILLLLVFFPFFIKAANYYVDPSSDSTKETGSISLPWKSLSSVNASMKIFKAGDSIFLKKGELYYERLLITCSGTENAPIVFTSYGTAAAIPVFLFKAGSEKGYNSIRLHNSKYVVLDGFQITDDNLSPENRSKTSNIEIAVNIDTSDFIVVKNCKVSLTGVGVNVQGKKNIIHKCSFENLRMIQNTPGGDDDYGANPVVLAGPENIISNCLFKDCWANSFDYQYDGGAIEFFGAANGNNIIINNTAINCNGFMEFGSQAEGSSDNNLVIKNTIINCGELVYINNDGKFKITVNNLQVFDNVIINSINQLTNPTSMIAMRSAVSTPGIINLQRNVFWLLSGIDVARNPQFSDGQLTHLDNIYYMPSGKLNFTADSSEVIMNKDAAAVKKLASLHPELTDMDIFPFLYLLHLL